jgi:hypothetical protein
MATMYDLDLTHDTHPEFAPGFERWMWEPEEDDLPKLISLVRVDETHTRITFNSPIAVSPDLRCTSKFVFTPALEVLEVDPETSAATTRTVLLTTKEQGPYHYQVAVWGIERP